jgi:uncharacterized protein (TIGR00369 family)
MPPGLITSRPDRAMTEDDLLADGWRRLPTVRYSAALGPSFSRMINGRITGALLAQEHLGNDNLGVVHGGAIMTFVDMAMGLGVGHATGSAGYFVTAQLSVQFVASANVGELVTCQPEVVRKTSSMVFMRGLILAGERTVASADGIFKLLNPERFASLKA